MKTLNSISKTTEEVISKLKSLDANAQIRFINWNNIQEIHKVGNLLKEMEDLLLEEESFDKIKSWERPFNYSLVCKNKPIKIIPQILKYNEKGIGYKRDYEEMIRELESLDLNEIVIIKGNINDVDRVSVHIENYRKKIIEKTEEEKKEINPLIQLVFYIIGAIIAVSIILQLLSLEV